MIKLKGALLTAAAFIGFLGLFVVLSFLQAYPEAGPNPTLVAMMGLAVLCLVCFVILKIPEKR